MAVKRRVKYNIDKLRECYIQPEGLFEQLMQYSKNNYIDYENFRLHIIDDGRGDNSDKQPMKIKANVLLADGTFLGDFVFHSSMHYDGRCFFSFANSALYSQTNIMHGQKFNHQVDIDYIATILGLKLNNHTEIEVAADVNYNIIAKVQKLVKDYHNYDMIVNGKRIIDENRKIEGFGEYYGRSRAKRDKYPTLYFSQAKSDGLVLKVYDKSREIKEGNPQKEYVEAWNEFGNQKIYRLELKIKNEQFKKWLDYACGLLTEWGDFERSQGLLALEAYKSPLWQFGVNRLVYFRHRATHKVITLFDIINGAKE